MSGLAGRVAARLDALEAGARAAIDDSYGARDWAGTDGATDAHIAAWDPAAVLRLVDGLRAVVGLHAENDARWAEGTCAVCADWPAADYDGAPAVPWPCPTLLGIAAALGVEVGE